MDKKQTLRYSINNLMYLKINSFLYDQFKLHSDTYLVVCSVVTKNHVDSFDVYLKLVGQESEVVALSAILHMKLKDQIVKAEAKEVYLLQANQKPIHVGSDQFIQFSQLIRNFLK